MVTGKYGALFMIFALMAEIPVSSPQFGEM
jgi:hypothetical protein